MATEVISHTQQVDCTITFLDADGKPTTVTAPQITVSDPTLCVLTVPVVPVGPVASVVVNLASTGVDGSFTLDVSAINADGSSVSGSQAVAVTDANAASVVFTFSAPTPLAVVAAPPAAD
jgi:hypothetical protein